MILEIVNCPFIKQETELNGQRATLDVIQPIPRYVEAIQKIEHPKNLRQLRNIIGKSTYYAKLIFFFLQRSYLLSDLVKGHSDDKKDIPIHLRRDAITAINSLKKKLTETPIFSYPDFHSDSSLIATTDASCTAISYIISHVQNDFEKVICYGSRKHSDADKQHHINKLKLPGVITCFEKNKFLIYPR